MLRKIPMKKIVSLILMVAMSITTLGFGVSADALTDHTFILKGTVYHNAIKEVKNQRDLNAALQIKALTVEDGKLHITGKLKHEGGSFELDTYGDMYQSQTAFLKENAITVDMRSNEQLEFLSFIIEKNAQPEMVLPINKHLKNTYVAKIAVKEIGSNKVFYFEDLMPGDYGFEVLSTQVKQPTEEMQEKLSFMESWFAPYLMNGVAQEDSKDYAEGLDRLTKALLKTDSIQLSNTGSAYPSATSPVYGIGVDAFKTVGKYYYTGSDAYGYYRITNEWPAGSGNKLTYLIKWNTITNAPVPSGSNGVANLTIEVEAQYIYNLSNDTISLYDNNSYLRIKESPNVQVALLTSNSDIITRVEKNITCNGSSVSVDWKSWLGLVPYSSNFLKFYDLATSVTYKEDTQVSNVLTFYDRIRDSYAAWGKVHKDYKLHLPSDKYLAKEGDKVELSVGIKKPVDAANYYTYKTGAKTAGYRFDFKIYSRDGWGLYNVFEQSITKDIHRTYY